MRGRGHVRGARQSGGGVQVAARLYERFPDVRTYNVCGGLIAWRNAGLPLEDAFGRPVAELHPHRDDLACFIAPPLHDPHAA